MTIHDVAAYLARFDEAPRMAASGMSENIAMTRIDSDAVDVRVEFQSVIVETRIGAWMRNLSESERDR